MDFFKIKYESTYPTVIVWTYVKKINTNIRIALILFTFHI
jgi:hypothetical protein